MLAPARPLGAKNLRRPYDAPSLRRALETALRETGHVDLHFVDVDVTDGNVRLTGTVSSYFIKQKAQIVVGAMAGTVPIENELSVAGAGSA